MSHSLDDLMAAIKENSNEIRLTDRNIREDSALDQG